MEVVKDPKPLAGGSMGSGGNNKKPPTTPNDRDNSSNDWREPRKWGDSSSDKNRYMNPRQNHFAVGHAESKNQLGPMQAPPSTGVNQAKMW